MLILLLACSAPPSETGATDTGVHLGDGLVERIELGRLEDHLVALQGHADDHQGTRLAGTGGYEAGLDWAESIWSDAGLSPVRQAFLHLIFEQLSEPLLSWDGAPDQPEIETFQNSPPGEVLAVLHGVDLLLPPGAENSSTSGCESSDFDGFPAGAIALMQRGTCTFSAKVANAQAAGAAAAIIFNEGQPGREDAVQGSLDGGALSIPAIGASFALGEALAAIGTTEVQLRVDTRLEEITVHNLLIDLPGASQEIVVVGAHLDSVLAGPGINDNGSGTALVVELAVQAALAQLQAEPTLRFALWGAEESGLIGSSAYVAGLSTDELDRHVATLNFDMVASPNGVRFVYDGDDSADLAGYPAPEGSETLEDLFTDWFDQEGLGWEATAFSGRSDYGPFILAGIPAGGLFTGAEGSKLDSEVVEFGGQAQEPYDACYHQACDTLDNVDLDLFLEMARAAAHATASLASAPPLTSRQPVRLGLPNDLPGCAHRVLR